MTGNVSVNASVTVIEAAPTVGSVQTYDLTQATFYPEDHELFSVTNGEYSNSAYWIGDSKIKAAVQELETERAKKKSEPTDEEQETIKSLKNDLDAFKVREKDGREVVMFSAKQMAIIVKAVLLNHKSLTNNAKNLAPLLQRFGGWKEKYAISALGYAVTQKECDELEEIFKPFAPAIGSIIKQYPTIFAEEKKAKLENNLGKNS